LEGKIGLLKDMANSCLKDMILALYKRNMLLMMCKVVKMGLRRTVVWRSRLIIRGWILRRENLHR